MFSISNSIRSRLASLLRPWTQGEPDIELELGFTRSLARARNLVLNASALDLLLLGGLKNRMSLKSARVGEICLVISPWGAPAFHFEVHGVDVIFAARDLEGCSHGLQESTDMKKKEMNQMLALLDPEGISLHETIGNISAITFSRNRLVTATTNIGLRHCWFKIYDIHLKLQLPVMDESIACFFRLKELHLESVLLDASCLLKGLLGAFFMSQEKSSFVLNGSGLEIGLKGKDQVNCIASSADLLNRIRLRNLQLSDFDTHAPQIKFAFSPYDLPVLLMVFDVLSSKEVKGARNGRELWKIAARGVGCLIPHHRPPFCRIVSTVVLWLRHVRAYEKLLLLVGYSDERTFNQTAARMAHDKRFSSCVKHQWNVISDIEGELPVEAVARARQLARHTVALQFRRSSESMTDVHPKFWWKVLTPLSFLWKFIWCIFYSIMRFLFFLRTLMGHDIEDGQSLLSDTDDSYSKQSFRLNLEEISITLSPIRAVHRPIKEKSKSDIQVSDLNLLSFCMTMNCLCFDYIKDLNARCLSIAWGSFKIQSSSFSRVPLMRTNSGIEMHHSYSGPQLKMDTELEAILWSEPAPQFQISNDEPTKFKSESWILILENYLGKMWSDWGRNGKRFKGNDIQQLELPFLLCEIKSFIMDPYLNAPDHGLWKCSLAVGKLTFNLDYLSIMSISLLLKQMQDICRLTATSGEPEVLSHTSNIIDDQTEMKLVNCCESYMTILKMTMLRLVPEKNIQIGAAIIGPTIRISMPGGVPGKHINSDGLDDCCFTIDVGNIEFSVWPTPEVVCGKPILDESEAKCLWLTDTHSLHSQKANSNGTYISHGCFTIGACLRCDGINALLEDLKENKQSQIFGPMSITVQSSSRREYWHSLTETLNASSMNFSGMATGATILCYVDELYTFFQVFQGLPVLSDAYINLDSTNEFYCQELIRKNMVSTNGAVNRNMLASEEKCVVFILKSTKFRIEASLNLGSLDAILSKSRKICATENCEKASSASTSAACQDIIATQYKETMLGMLFVPEFGVGVSVQRSCVQIFSEEGLVKVLLDVFGIQSVIFRFQDQIENCNDGSEFINLSHKSSNCLYEFSLSDFTLSISAGPHGNSLSSRNSKNAVDGSNSSNMMPSYAVEVPDLVISSEASEVQSCGPSQELGQAQLMTSALKPASNSWFLLINIGLGAILLVERSMKNVLLEAHQTNKLTSSLSVGGESHLISCDIQGGLLLLDTTALAIFTQCFRAYLLCIMDILSISPRQSESIAATIVLGEGTTSPSDQLEDVQDAGSSVPPPGSHTATLEIKWKFQEVLTVRLSKFSLVLASADGSGGVWELMLGTDCHLKLELVDARRKFLFDLSRLTVVSQHLQRNYLDQTARDAPVPHFHSYSADAVSSQTGARHSTLPSLIAESKLPVQGDSPPVPTNGVLEDDYSKSHVVHQRNDILKHMTASLTVEKAVEGCEVGPLWLKNEWVGSGCISGFDLTIMVSEIQMFFALIAPLSAISSGKTSQDTEQKLGSRNQHENDISQCTNLDGAVVAIEDMHQHMYLAVESTDNMYHLGGAVHYSLVGVRALFRVRYCRQWRWKSPVSWFTLTSLHAKNDAGEPLRLNFRPGSAFVDISSTDDKGWSLWRMFPYRPESYEGDNDMESYYQLTGKSFYLVNQKSDCAVAFIDGLPEFVKKPGNPFKMKVFDKMSPTQGIVRQDVRNTYTNETYETNEQENITNVDNGMNSMPATEIPFVNVTIDKVTFTILYEIPDANEKFPLLRGTLDNFQFILQIASPKLRLISTMTAGIYYLDASRNLWRELLFPVEVCMFYRSRYMFQSEEVAQYGVPVCFYCRMGRVDLSLTQISLDILLFLAGKLDLAGPYAVKSSMIFANCCKVENRSGLSLLCHFDDNQDVRIAGKQSASIFLRRESLANQLPENSRLLSLQLVALGTFSTSPIHISLLDTRVLSWRTRVVSLQDSRTFPGPFVVVDISRKSEDGLSLIISPLLRIYNASGFSMELRFRRPQDVEAEYASIVLQNGDTIDDCMAVFDALNLSGGLKKALMSLSLGNFLLSFRPVADYFEKSGKPVSINWSEDLKGGKAVRLSGIFDKLNYRFKKAFGAESVKSSLSTVFCSLSVEGSHLTNLHFLIEAISRNVPVIRPPNTRDASETSTSPVALQEQREIFIFPTVQVSNLLQSEILVLLTECHPDLRAINSCDLTGKQATIPCGSSAYLYANPDIIYFTVTLTAFNSKCKPVNSGDWVKKLQKQKGDVHYLDIELDFGGGRYFASLRLSHGERGILEAVVFSSYTLQNYSHLSLFCYASNRKALSRTEVDKYGSSLPPELGSVLPPKSSCSWLLKSNKVYFKCLEGKTSEALLDLDALSGFTEICLEVQEEAGVKHIEKLGVSLKPSLSKTVAPSQMVYIVPRYVISNESEVAIIVRQCYMEDDSGGTFDIDSQQKVALPIRTVAYKRKQISFFDHLLKKHRHTDVDSFIFIQFSLRENGWTWSGPVCIASLGHFFLKFKRSPVSLGHKSNSITEPENKLVRYAVAYIVEEDSSLVLHFQMPPNFTVPYRIENCLNDVSITYYQKESTEPEILGPGNSVEYVWDDFNLPHKLVVQITGMNLLRDINIDKVCAWKPFLKIRKTRGLPLHVSWDNKIGDGRRTKFDESPGLDMLKMGYEVYADGSTRVLRICEFIDNRKEDKMAQPRLKFQFRISYFAIHLLENAKQHVDWNESSIYSTIIVARLGNITLDSVFTSHHKCHVIKVQTLNVDEKWQGAPFAAMLRRNRLEDNDLNDSILHVVFILPSTKSNVKQVKYSSIVLQPIDLNIYEETLMRLVPFWRTSLSDSSKPSRQFYFRHFEIHPIKIVASFLPGSPNSSYSSAQETLRSLLHSVIKIPSVKNMVVELNGVLLTHAVVTARELIIKCAQHYSWYAVRAVYIAKGSPLLPPAFASIFDDSASSSLDVFFDPSSGLINLPGVTLGMFKFISKCIDTKGFSGTKRYLGDLGKTMKMAGSNLLFAAITEISDNVLKGAETSGFNGMVNGFHQGILKLAMEPSLLGAAVMEGGPDRKIKLDRSPGVDELYIEGYLQAMLDVIYKQEYLRVRVIEDQVILKNLPPNSSLINEIMEHVKSFLMSKALLQGKPSMSSSPLRHLQGESEWKIGPTVLTLCEHLFVSFSIRMLRKQANKLIAGTKWKGKSVAAEGAGSEIVVSSSQEKKQGKINLNRGVSKFLLSGVVAYIDGRLCRCIPNAIARRIVSGFLLSFLDTDSSE
ncbi:hypothetical protein AAC387_Pa02g3508 [Persea americana]